MVAPASKIMFSRDRFLEKITRIGCWDVLVVGGGATGLGVAVDAASRGFSTLLLEQADFAKGTSSRSTKLVHGGVRYLAQGDVQLVREALRERGLLLRNAPHLVERQSFVIPCYRRWERLKYLAGLKIYDWMSGGASFGRSRALSRAETEQALPGIRTEGLKGGIEYFDGRFDDSRLALNLARTCAEKGGTLLNYMQVIRLTKTGKGKVGGVVARDVESGKEYALKARAVINATGVFVDRVLHMDDPSSGPLVRPSQGAHVVLDRSLMKGGSALMIPETRDGRVLFAVPWHGKLLVGTTDTPLDEDSLEPRALDEEIAFILGTAGKYLERPPSEKDILSIFAGLRPLAAPQKNTSSTKEISRSHKLIVSKTGLITITGGKWTTYRKMAEDTVDSAVGIAKLPLVKCRTKNLKIHGYLPSELPAESGGLDDPFRVFGADAALIKALARREPRLGEPLHELFPYPKALVVWSVRHEMARTVEDVLARRLRLLFLDARTAIAMAPAVARLMAAELGKDDQWQAAQVEAFTDLARQYLPAARGNP